MKKLLITLLIFTLFSFQVSAAVNYLPGDYKIDPDHTRVGFVVQHFIISEVEGRFNDVKGDFTLAPKFKDSKVQAVVEINSIDTAVKKRDEDLRSQRFFDAATFPTMALKSKHFKGTPENFTLVADLTIKDVTKEVTFKGAYTGEMKDPWGNDRVAIHMTGKINRKDFNINYNEKASNGPDIGDIVTIIVRADGVKKGK